MTMPRARLLKSVLRPPQQTVWRLLDANSPAEYLTVHSDCPHFALGITCTTCLVSKYEAEQGGLGTRPAGPKLPACNANNGANITRRYKLGICMLAGTSCAAWHTQLLKDRSCQLPPRPFDFQFTRSSHCRASTLKVHPKRTHVLF